MTRKTIVDFYKRHPDAEQPLKAWLKVVREAQWQRPQDVKNFYRNASFLKNERVVFNIAGNKYRIVAWINYEFKTIYLKFIGTHKQYDAIDAENV